MASGRPRYHEVSDFLHWLKVTHAQQWHVHDHTTGSGHLYQGRFKSFPVESDDRAEGKKERWKRFAAACSADSPTAASHGANGSSRAWASNPPYALAAGPERRLQSPEKNSRLPRPTSPFLSQAHV